MQKLFQDPSLGPDDLPTPAICEQCWKLFGVARALAIEQRKLVALYHYCKHRQVLVIAGFGKEWAITSWTVLSPMTEEQVAKLIADSARDLQAKWGPLDVLAKASFN